MEVLDERLITPETSELSAEAVEERFADIIDGLDAATPAEVKIEAEYEIRGMKMGGPADDAGGFGKS